MKLLFQNLADWLTRKGYELTCDIKKADAQWEHVQWLFEGSIQPQRIYIDIPAEFYDGPNYISIVDIHGNLIRIKHPDAQEIFNTIIDMTEFFSQWYRNLLSCVLMKKPMEELLQVAAEYFRSPMILGAEDGHLFSYTTEYLHLIPADQQPYFTNEALSYMMHHAPQYQMSRSLLFGKRQPYFETSLCFTKIGTNQNVRKLVANLFRNQQRCGFINIYEYNHPFYPGDLYIMQILAEAAVQRMYLEPEKYLSPDYLEFILQRLCSSQNVDQSQIDYVFQYNTWKQADRFTLICAERKHKSDSITSQLSVQFLQKLKTKYPSCRCIVVGQQIAVLVDRTLLPNLDQLLHYLCNAPIALCIGISNDFEDILNTRYYWQQASQVQKEAATMGMPLANVSDAISWRMQEILSDSPLLLSYCHPIYKKLHLLDWQEHTQLEKTLGTFILTGCNYTDTANLLKVHRNTVMKRMDRVREMTDYDETSTMQYEALLLSALMIPQLLDEGGNSE